MQMRDELFHWKQASEDQEQFLVMKYSNHHVFQIQIKSWKRQKSELAKENISEGQSLVWQEQI